MVDQEVDVLAIGAGPANLALAIALEEIAELGERRGHDASGAAALASRTLILEQYPDVRWQRNLLLPWARSQVSFLKDLVTLRNPRSRFSMLNFLHEQDRLDSFVNLATFNPYRWELSQYMQWVADSLEQVGIRYNARVTSVQARHADDGTVVGWTAALAGGDTVRCRDLVIGIGRDAQVPEVFAALPPERVIHSSQYAERIAAVPTDRPVRVVVVGGAQSAAELFMAVHQDLPASRPLLVHRSVGLQNYQTSKFVNELFYPSFVDDFYDCPPQVRGEILQEVHQTNYAGCAPPFLDEIYMMLYQQRTQGTSRSEIKAMTEVVDARVEDDEVVLDLRDRRTGKVVPTACDLVLLGTGFDPRMPGIVRRLAADLGLAEVAVGRRYRVDLGDSAWGAVYLQGVNEQTHGIADSLLSVLAHRSQDIVADLLDRRGLGLPAPGSQTKPARDRSVR